MTVEEVRAFVHEQSKDHLTTTNEHHITLKQALIPPQRILLIARQVRDGHLKDEKLNAWLLGQEKAADGYRIVLCEDGSQFGLASTGFKADEHLVLTGWYGSLLSAFLNM
jgi:hypothetical protein